VALVWNHVALIDEKVGDYRVMGFTNGNGNRAPQIRKIESKNSVTQDILDVLLRLFKTADNREGFIFTGVGGDFMPTCDG
jgi:hypothetical protein